jgi:hypothetical protein
LETILIRLRIPLRTKDFRIKFLEKRRGSDIFLSPRERVEKKKKKEREYTI